MRQWEWFFLLIQIILTNILPYYGDADVAGVQHPQPSVVDDEQDNVKQLHELTSVNYGEQC